MAQNLYSKVRAKVWLSPDQIDDLRSACYSTGADYLKQRDEAIIALMYDTGHRVGELVSVDVDLLREANSVLYVPTEIQKSSTQTITSLRRRRWSWPQTLYGCCHRISTTAGKIHSHCFR